MMVADSIIRTRTQVLWTWSASALAVTVAVQVSYVSVALGVLSLWIKSENKAQIMSQ